MTKTQHELEAARESATTGTKVTHCKTCTCSKEQQFAPVEDREHAATVLQTNFRKVKVERSSHADSVYNAESRIDNQAQHFEGKTLSWLRKWMVDLYATKIVADASDDRRLNRRQTMAEFLLDHGKISYGGEFGYDSLHCDILLRTIRRYLDDNLDVKIFWQFLRGELTLPAQNTYLHIMHMQGDNKKGKAPRTKVSLESSWSVYAETGLGKLSTEFWDMYHEAIGDAWKADGSRVEPRHKRERLMSSDVLRCTLTNLAVEFDILFGRCLCKLYRKFAPGGSLEEPLNVNDFRDLLLEFDSRLSNQYANWWNGAKQFSTEGLAEDEIDWEGMVALSEMGPPILKATFRANYSDLKGLCQDDNQADFLCYTQNVHRYYEMLLHGCKADDDTEHTDFCREIKRVLEETNSDAQ